MDYKINSEQQEMLDKIFSSVLPHSGFNSKIASDTLSELNKFLTFKDLYGQYYVIWLIFKNIDLLGLYRDGLQNVLTKQNLDNSLTTSLPNLITRQGFDAKRLFDDYGQSFNLEVPTEKNDAMNFVYSTIMNSYDEWINTAVPSEEGLSLVPILRESMKNSMAAVAISLQSQVLQDGIYYNKKFYHGYVDWLAFTTVIHNEIQSRFTRGALSKRYSFESIDSYEKSIKFDNDNDKNVHPLWYMGWDPVDNRFPINTHDIVTVVADEGTGKTRFVVDQAYRAIVAGCSVVIVCGETDSFKIKRLIESRHLFDRYQKQLTMQELSNPDLIKVDSEESLQMIKNMIIESNTDFYDNPNYGKLILIQNLTYESIEEQLREEYKVNKFDVVFIDHVAALDTSGRYVNGERLGTMQEKITHLYRVEDVLAKDLNISFVNTSHTNNDTSAAILKGKATGTRIGGQSAATTKYASIVLLITQPQDYKKNDQIVVEFKKIRDHEPITMPMLINRNSSNYHYYVEEVQGLLNGGADDNTDIEALY